MQSRRHAQRAGAVRESGSPFPSWRQLVVDHLSVAQRVAARWVRLHKVLRPHLEDLVQEACIGLVIAAKRFRPERQVRFETYAWWWATQYVRRAARRMSGPVRTPDTEPCWARSADLDACGTFMSLPASAELATEASMLSARFADSCDEMDMRSGGTATARGGHAFLRILLLDETQAAIARESGLSRERIRQMHDRAAALFAVWRTGVA